MKNVLRVFVFGWALSLGLLCAYAAPQDVGECIWGEDIVDLAWDDSCELDEAAFGGSDGDWFVYSEASASVAQESAAWWLLLFLGRGYVINGGNIISRGFPLIKTHGGLHAWAGTQFFMNILYIASMYAKLIEKADLGDPTVVNGIKGKAHIDLGKTAGFYMDTMGLAIDYVRELRLQGRSEVVAASGEGVAALAQDQWGLALDGLLEGVGWLAHLTGTSMNVASLTSKYYKVWELEAAGDATEAEMQRAWRDVYVYIVKLSGGVVGLAAKLAYAGAGYERWYIRKTAMSLSILGSALFLYWDMGGAFSLSFILLLPRSAELCMVEVS